MAGFAPRLSGHDNLVHALAGITAADHFRFSSAIKLDVSQRLPPIACTSE